MKHLKQFESVFDNVENLFQTTDLEELFKQLQEVVAADKEFMKYDAEENVIQFPQLGAIATGQFNMQIYHTINMDSDGEILVRRAYRDGIGMSQASEKISTYTLIDVKDLKDAVTRLKDFVIKYHKAHKVLSSVEAEMDNARDAILQLPAENTDYRSGL